jgi:hypothetical protein
MSVSEGDVQGIWFALSPYILKVSAPIVGISLLANSISGENVSSYTHDLVSHVHTSGQQLLMLFDIVIASLLHRFFDIVTHRCSISYLEMQVTYSSAAE